MVYTAINNKARFAEEQVAMMKKLAAIRLDEIEKQVRSSGLSEEVDSTLTMQRSIRVEDGSTLHPGVDGIVDSFFEGTKNDDSKVRDGYKAIVKTGFQDFLEDDSQGEIQDNKFFICAKNDKLVRVDAYAFRFNFPVESNAFTYPNVMAYLLCERAVDADNISVEQIVEQVSNCAGDNPEQSEAYLSKMIETWKEQKFEYPGSPKKQIPMSAQQDMLPLTSPIEVGKQNFNNLNFLAA